MDSVVLQGGPHRVLHGSPWVYRSEIQPNQAEPGATVAVKTREGRVLGQGFYNPQSMIAVRMVQWGVPGALDEAFWRRRLTDAVRLRERVALGRDAYRVVYSEADGLPGLVVDKYGPMLVVQITSLGLMNYLPMVLDVLIDLLKPRGIFEMGQLSVRRREGLPFADQLLYGELVSPVVIHEHGVSLTVDLHSGQKTGHFLDQYHNRAVAGHWAAGARVFDAFCHTGGFGLVAARHGAEFVTGIDQDADAITRAEDNARINQLTEHTTFLVDNAFDWLRKESDKGAQYDLGILDPPAFTKSKQSLARALRGYKEINLRGLKLMRPGGILITSSCSYHVSEPAFVQVIQEAAFDVKRHVRILNILGQGPDHPILPSLPESRYLKCLVVEVGD